MRLPTPFSQPLYITTKTAGNRCNLDCAYCYYLEKDRLYDQTDSTMGEDLLELFINQYIEAQTSPDVLFTWHGGEPLLRGHDFYRRAVKLQSKYDDTVRIENSIQTNGTLINDDWCRFFKEHDWLVGVSIDGPEPLHDAYRRDKADGATFRKVMHGIELLDKHGVRWNALAAINDYNASYPVEFYKFFESIACRHIQFTPVVERIDSRMHLASYGQSADAKVTGYSVSPQQWGEFLCTVFDLWVSKDVGKVFVQLFDATLANWVGIQPGLCSAAKDCGHAGVIEHNGDIYSCDHFVFPQYKLGNIRRATLLELMSSEAQQRFGNLKRSALTQQCRDCTYLNLCNGECPRNRFALSDSGEPNHNYLCAGYRRFYSHSEAAMRFMRDEIYARRSPSNVMKHFGK